MQRRGWGRIWDVANFWFDHLIFLFHCGILSTGFGNLCLDIVAKNEMTC